MNDTAIKNFCTWARTALIEGVAQRMERYDASEGAEAGLAAVGPLVLSPQEAAWRDDLLRLCREEGAGRLRDRAAYTWFNRIAAVRYMEVHDFLPSRVRMFTRPAADGSWELGSQAVDEALDLQVEGIDPARVAELKAEDKLLEAQRLQQRTDYDLELLETMGFCTGIENYSRHLDGRRPGEPPFTLIDYFPKDMLCIIDESHVTVPQIRGMHEGDRSRKVTLVEHGFRLPSALDNRPLRFDEFEARIPQFIYVSATPGDYELRVSQNNVEQIIRPTGLLDPKIDVRPVRGQIDDLLDEIRERTARHERVLVTTLTKRMAEDLTDYLLDAGVKVNYMHSDTATMDRVEILRDLRRGKIDVLVGINLLREGLDLPEVSLVAILDADKEGFLRNRRSLIQTIGRAARNAEGEVIMYADTVTDSMREAIDETQRRREIQMAYNEEHHIEPKTVRKAINDISSFIAEATENVGKRDRSRGDTLGHGEFFTPAGGESVTGDTPEQTGSELVQEMAKLPQAELARVIAAMEEDMRAASEAMDFEQAANLRDALVQLKAIAEGGTEEEIIERLRAGARKGSAFGGGRRRTGFKGKK